MNLKEYLLDAKEYFLSMKKSKHEQFQYPFAINGYRWFDEKYSKTILTDIYEIEFENMYVNIMKYLHDENIAEVLNIDTIIYFLNNKEELKKNSALYSSIKREVNSIYGIQRSSSGYELTTHMIDKVLEFIYKPIEKNTLYIDTDFIWSFEPINLDTFIPYKENKIEYLYIRSMKDYIGIKNNTITKYGFPSKKDISDEFKPALRDYKLSKIM